MAWLLLVGCWRPVVPWTSGVAAPTALPEAREDLPDDSGAVFVCHVVQVRGTKFEGQSSRRSALMSHSVLNKWSSVAVILIGL